MYYSVEEGVVGFKFNTGEIYVLKIKNAIRNLLNTPEAIVRGKLVKKGGQFY
jgi:hypothetical protein